MTDNGNAEHPFFRPAISSVQRKCEHCEEEEKKMQRKETGGETPEASGNLENYVDGLGKTGNSLPAEMRSFFGPRMGYNFDDVRIHTDSAAAKSAQSINALAYTTGNNIVFDSGQFSPGTDSGKKLLGHELTHVVQQQSGTIQRFPFIQRAVRSGQDHAGSYAFDDAACALQYSQDWYFSFPSGTVATVKNAYMSRAKNQVEGSWSNKFPLIPSGGNCPCHYHGVNVGVAINAFDASRNGRHGYDINVVDHWSGVTSQPTRNITLADTQDFPETKTSTLTQPVISHEFGHTVGITDEYAGWAAFWHAVGNTDDASLMHTGDQIRPRHYQHFADLINFELENCQYHPEGYSSLALANPLVRFNATGALRLDNAQFVLDLSIDRRASNADWLGLFTPRVGFETQLNAANGNIAFGPTAGLSLNRIAHPIYLDIRTGVLLDPADPGRPASLNIPLSVTAGIRGNGFGVGVNYTGMYDVLGNAGYTHILGVNLEFDLPGGR